ncbi:uncharacterized protein LOC103509149 [Diaphorina citri]|uniref:Uncharacterized protein LOC103509149 n=1 Tax=Diaphorina citri TaxID=121845 RepID=A0A1S4EBQ7_DIACI|nr:uncharacterized protein LOC103509149 [Diaphorina citri]XP_026679361.1 uncharacterized protein LOC103509149 [Diaphorina citri]KAI5746845.1 hypothetical protein M8J77_008078 [Diaphorina citri]
MADISQECEDLNYDCNYNIFLAKQYLPNLRSMTDRQKASKWMRKLLSCAHTMDEMKLRNDFMYYLVLNLQAGELQAPFTLCPPPPGPLSSLLALLPQDKSPPTGCLATECIQDSQDLPLLYRQSPDGGAFLAAQPVPRCGAFCYLAVVCGQDEKE